MNNISLRSNLHISVASALQPLTDPDWETYNELGLLWEDYERQLGLLKAALLYADRITVYALTSPALATDAALLYQREVLDAATKAFTKSLKPTDKLRKGGNLSELLKKLRERFLGIKSERDSQVHNFAQVVNPIAHEIHRATKSGLVESTHYFDNTLPGIGLVDNFFNAVKFGLERGLTYPILDDTTGLMVDNAIKKGKLVLPGATRDRAKHAGVSSNLLHRLPLFEAATIQEILDIRRELEKPLVRFRSAIVGFSKQVENVPWHTNFSYEVDELFMERVEPSILDIEESTKSNKLLLDLAFRSLTVGVPTSAVIGLAISQLDHLPGVIAGGLSGIAASAAGAYSAHKDYREKDEGIKARQLYFLYRAGKLLSGKPKK